MEDVTGSVRYPGTLLAIDVAVYLDGAYVGTAHAMMTPPFDIGRATKVEVAVAPIVRPRMTP